MKIQAVSSALLFLGTAILPVYVFASGGVQPAHAVLACFAGLTLIRKGIPVKSWSLSLLAIFVYSFLVESIYVIDEEQPETLINSIFFLYNFVLVCAVYQYVRQVGLSALVPGILVAAGIALVSILITGVDLREMADTGRSTATFNNPNQLGFFSVCLLSLGYLSYRHRTVNYWWAACIFAVSLFLAISSLSKAAMVANFFVIGLALKPISSRYALLGWSLGVLAGGALLLNLFRSGAFDEFLFMERLANMVHESDSSLESRGYFAFIEGNSLQLLFGLGAQGVDEIVGHEVHATLASVFNNYGLFGLLIFSVALAVWAVRLWDEYGFVGLVCLTGPATLYGLTHNGVRFVFFWILFAASIAMAERGRHIDTAREKKRTVPLFIPNRD